MAFEWIETVEDLKAGSASMDKGKLKATRVFKLQFDVIPDENGATEQVPLWKVLLGGYQQYGLPAYNSPLDDLAPNTTAQTYTPKYDSDSYDIIVVEVGYDFNSWLGETPIGKRTVRWTSRNRNVEYFYDASDDQKPAVNTAGEPFPQSPKRDESVETFRMSLNVAPDKTLSDYQGIVNRTNKLSITLDGINCGAGTIRVTSRNLSEIQEDGGVQYKTLELEGEYNPDGFKQDIDSRGYREISASDNNKLQDIMKGIPPTKVQIPYPLDENGQAADNPDDEPAVVTMQPYKEFETTGLFA